MDTETSTKKSRRGSTRDPEALLAKDGVHKRVLEQTGNPLMAALAAVLLEKANNSLPHKYK